MSQRRRAPRLVLIEWLDSVGCGASWEPIGSMKPQRQICHSVGYLLRDEKDTKVVVPHVSEGSNGDFLHGSGDMSIPTKSIVKIRDLKFR